MTWAADVKPTIGDEARFATKPALDLQMLSRAMNADLPATWATADETHSKTPRVSPHNVGHGDPTFLAITAGATEKAALQPARTDSFPSPSARPDVSWHIRSTSSEHSTTSIDSHDGAHATDIELESATISADSGSGPLRSRV